MKNFLLVGFLCANLTGYTQIDYHLHDSLLLEAYRTYEKEDHKKAIALYQRAFRINGAGRPVDYLIAANSAAFLESEDISKKLLVEAITKKKTEPGTIQSFSDNALYQKCAENVLADYDKLLNTYYTSIQNMALYQRIQALVQRDQFARKIGNYYLGISEKDQEQAFDAYLEAQQRKDTLAMAKNKAILWPQKSEALNDMELGVIRNTDSLNIVALIDIVTQFGWQDEAHILLWHQRGNYGQKDWVWDFFIPFINNEIKDGRVEPSFWAMFEDFKSIQENGSTIYGYHPGKVNAKEVNAKRSSIGLPQLTKAEIEERNQNPYGGRRF